MPSFSADCWPVSWTEFSERLVFLWGSEKETEGVDEEAIGTDRGSQFSVALSAESSVEEGYRRRARCGKVWRFVDESLSASVKSQHCLQIFRSAWAVRQEIKRQRKINRFIIHPFSEFRWNDDPSIIKRLILYIYWNKISSSSSSASINSRILYRDI